MIILLIPINNIFINIESDIKKSIYESYGIITRKTKLSYTNTFIYSLECCKIDKTKIDIVNEFNLKQNDSNIISRTTFYEKSLKIPLSYYANVYYKIKDVYTNYFIDKSKDIILAGDGTYSNSNVYNIKGYLETSLNLGLIDVDNDIPIELMFNGEEAKNKEVEILNNYILENKDKMKNVIFVLDRAYCSYKFINFCYKNKIKFVIRFKNNCINIPNKYRTIIFSEYVTETVVN
jgi:hypothetical protein